MEVKAVRNVVSGDRHELPKAIRKTRLPEVRKCMCFQKSLSTRSTFFAVLSKRNDFQNFCNQHSVLTLHMFFSSFAEWCEGTKNIFKKKRKKENDACVLLGNFFFTSNNQNFFFWYYFKYFP